jgi:hypothetical protein
MKLWLAKYYKNKNIRLNRIHTVRFQYQQPQLFLVKYRESCTIKGMLDPADVVVKVLLLLSNQSKYFNVQNILIDEGGVL